MPTNDEIINEDIDTLVYKMRGAFDSGDTTNPYTMEDVKEEIKKRLEKARADERSNMMELLDEVVIDLPEKNDETYENGINDLAVAFKVAMKEKYPYEDMRKKVQTDTAKQIFKELDEAVWEQIEPSRLEEFLEQFSNAKDLKASLNVATAFSIIGLDAEKYEALKKQYNLEA